MRRWIVRLTEKETGTGLHGTVNADKFSSAIEAAKEKFGARYNIHLVYLQAHLDRVAQPDDEGKPAQLVAGK